MLHHHQVNRPIPGPVSTAHQGTVTRGARGVGARRFVARGEPVSRFGT